MAKGTVSLVFGCIAFDLVIVSTLLLEVLAFRFIGIIPSIVAIILGVLGVIKDIDAARNIAIAGLVLGIISYVIVLIEIGEASPFW